MNTDGRDCKGRQRAVVTGMDLIMPGGVGLHAVWPRLLRGQSDIGKITRFDTTAFKTQIAGEAAEFLPSRWFEEKEVRRNDRSTLLGVAAAEMAVANAGLDVRAADATRIGVLVGSGLGGLETLENQHQVLRERGPGRVSPFFIAAVIPNLIPGQISIRLGAKGPNWTVVSACASGAHAIGEAVELVRRGACDAVVCGGAEATITPMSIAGFNAMKALSTRNEAPAQASRPWDRGRDGFVMSEGAGMLVVESLEHARRRQAPIFAEIIGYGASSDAYHIAAPSGEGAERCMRLALDDAAVDPTAVAYINAHATSTPLGDVQEINAIKRVFGAHASRLRVSSTKSMHGHLLGAAGAVEAILTIEMLRHGVLLPTINLDDPEPECDLNMVAHTAQENRFNVACSNSFGFGGANATLVLRAWA